MIAHNLLVLSDIHLGSDLVQHARPGAPPRCAASERRDRELGALLDWYRERPEGGQPWRLVIAGDLVDFVGMSVCPVPGEIATEPTEEEREHGLGSAVDHTLAKLRRVAEHHREVFVALGRFVAAGNTLVIVRGNHDVDFHWQPVQEAFCAILAEHAPTARGRVEFSDWFYYEEGRVFIEHGHQYDAYCSYDHVLHPVSPSDPRRSHLSLSDVLLRYVVRPTHGMLEAGHDKASAIDYLRFGARLGWRGLLALGRRFALAVTALFRLYREHYTQAARWVRDEHERKMAMLAEARQISLVKLRALAALQRPPVTRSLFRILAGVMLDRVAFGVALTGMLVYFVLSRWTLVLAIELAVGLALIAPLAFLLRRLRGALDASDALREGATRIASLFPAAFIVMGHTHLPELRQALPGEATYVNLGAWAEEEAPEGAAQLLPASRTHLVVHEIEGRPVALLLRWDATRGPLHFLELASSEASESESTSR